MEKKQIQKKIIRGLNRGRSIKDSCYYAGISRNSFYRRIEEDADFADEAAYAQDNVHRLAYDMIYDSLQDKDIGIAKWLLDKKFKENKDTEQEYSIRQILDEIIG